MSNPPCKLFDTHAHFFTNDVRSYPVDLTGAREGSDTLMARLERDPATAKRILALWDECHVTGGAAVQYNTVYKTDNSYAIAVADAHHDRVSAVLILDAAASDTPAKLERLASQHNVGGLRLFGQPDGQGNYPWLDSPAALATWDVATASGLHMILMYAPGKPSQAALRRIVALARRYPATTIALDHCAWLGFGSEGPVTIGPEHRDLIDVPNILFKITQINFNRLRDIGADAADFVHLLVETYGAGRVMWGSDYGNTTIGYADMVAQAIAATRRLSEAQRAALLHDNGARLFADRLTA